MRRLVLPLACVAFLALAPSPASACSCDGFATLPQELERSREIYTGFVVSIEPSPGQNPYEVLITLRPHWIWRGTPTDGVFQVITGVDEGVCGIDFTNEGEYLVFAHATNPYSSTWLCGRTHVIYPGDPDIDALGPPIVTPVRPSSWGALKTLYR